MKKGTLFVKFAAAVVSSCIIILMTAIFLLCNCEHQPVTMHEAEQGVERVATSPGDVGVIPFTTEDPETGEVYEGIIYTHESEIGYHRIETVFNTSLDIAAITEELTNEGFEFVLTRSNYFKTSALHNGRPAQVLITVLTFEQETMNPDEVSYAIIRYCQVSGVRDVLQMEKLFFGENPWLYWAEESNDQVYYIGDYDVQPVWTQSFPPIITNPYASDGGGMLSPMAPTDSIPDGDPRQWDWEAFMSCVAIEAAVGCAVAGGVCITSDDPYQDCVQAGCSRAAIGAVISCGFQQIY